MADTLEIRLGGQVSGRAVTTRDLDYSEVHPLIDRIETAAIIEAGLDTLPRPGRRAKGQLRPLSPVRLALANVFTPDGTDTLGAVYQFAVGSETSEAVSKITAGLARVAGNQLAPQAAEEVQKGLNRTIWRGLSVQLVNGVETPVFSVSNPPPPLDVYPTRKFESEIVTRVLRVGGKKPVARVRLLGSGQEVTLELSGPKAARELGHHLYRDAILKGQGEWVIDPSRFSVPTRLLRFKVSRIRLLQDVTIDTVIEEMTKATGGVWDHVDPTDPEQVEDTPGGCGDLPR
jgi:hypothetical protein